jgi:hypothetical protein
MRTSWQSSAGFSIRCASAHFIARAGGSLERDEQIAEWVTLSDKHAQFAQVSAKGGASCDTFGRLWFSDQR